MQFRFFPEFARSLGPIITIYFFYLETSSDESNCQDAATPETKLDQAGLLDILSLDQKGKKNEKGVEWAVGKRRGRVSHILPNLNFYQISSNI